MQWEQQLKHMESDKQIDEQIRYGGTHDYRE